MFSKQYTSNRRLWLLMPLLFALTVVFWACKDDNPDTVPQPQTIAELVASGDQFNQLEAALARAGLTTTLSGTGPFTVFAPTDAAFQAAGITNVSSLSANALQNILLYHVVSGTALSSSSFPNGQTARPTALTVNGTAYVTKGPSSTASSGLSINGARVLQDNIQASNGTIHVIDRILMPPTGSILAVAQADTSLTFLTAAALRGGALVTGALSGTTTALTVLAPTNSAFRAAGFPTIAAINAAPEATLTAVLTNHVIPAVRAYSPTLSNTTLTTFGGGSLTVTVGSNNAISILSRGNGTNASNVTTPDISATNGVVHKINRVLLP